MDSERTPPQQILQTKIDTGDAVVIPLLAKWKTTNESIFIHQSAAIRVYLTFNSTSHNTHSHHHSQPPAV